ncbi:MAG: hypothetical protein Q8P46_03910 [Hyphomicrobiales bacterium]|nr:hypothetical protein [Hyphomicrobiales bacterium]
MRSKDTLDGALVACCALVFGGGLLMTLGWPATAALFPRLICGLGLAVSLLAGVGLLWRVGAKGDSSPEESNGHRQLAVVGWVVGFFLAVWMLGFQVGLPLAVALYYVAVARIAPWAALVLAAAAASFIWLAQGMLHLPMYAGLLLGG